MNNQNKMQSDVLVDSRNVPYGEIITVSAADANSIAGLSGSMGTVQMSKSQMQTINSAKLSGKTRCLQPQAKPAAFKGQHSQNRQKEK